MVVFLEQGAELHMAQLMPLRSLSLASVKSRLVLVSAHLGNTGLSPDARKTGACVRACVHACMHACMHVYTVIHNFAKSG